jgi:hypothetical protein
VQKWFANLPLSIQRRSLIYWSKCGNGWEKAKKKPGKTWKNKKQKLKNKHGIEKRGEKRIPAGMSRTVITFFFF